METTMYEKKIKSDVFCPISYGLGMIDGKWKSRIICVMSQMHPIRYGELKSEMANITDTALANALRELERDGLILRHQYNEMPIRVEYELTEKGQKIVPILLLIADWANGDMPLDKRRGDMPLCMQCRYNDAGQGD